MMPTATTQPSDPAESALSPAPVSLRVDDRTATDAPAGTALGVATSRTPRLSWIVPLVRAGQAQTAYEIRASRSSDALAGDAWMTGLVESDQNSDVAWGGDPLVAHERLRFAVRTADEHGILSEWSEQATIVTGPLDRSDWTAEWITFPTAHAASRDVELRADDHVDRAVIHIAGHGVVRIEVDGDAVNADARDLTDASLKRATSRSYDVTGHFARSDAPASRSPIASRSSRRSVTTARCSRSRG